MKFDLGLVNSFGKRHFKGIYEPNNPAHIFENVELTKDQPRNYYAYLAKNLLKLKKELQSTKRKAKTVAQMSEEEKEYFNHLRDYSPERLFSNLELLLRRITKKEVVVKDEVNEEFQAYVDETMAKFKPANEELMFHCFRARIEQLQRAGFSVQPIT